MKRLVSFALAVTCSVSASVASAEPREPLAWQAEWTKFRPVEYGVTGVAIGGAAVLLLTSPDNRAPRWTGGVLVDDGVRDALRLSSPAARRRAQDVGTKLYFGALAFPYLVDVAGTSLLVHRNPEIAAQLALMDTEVFALVGVLNFGLTNAIARQRPLVRACEGGNDPEFPRCTESGRDYQSFFGGHAAVAFAGAGLTCAHHQHLPLYGGGAPDILICAALVANGAAVAWTRMMADKHYFSDNLVGAALGFGLGYGIPSYLHYRGKGSLTARLGLPGLPVPVLTREQAGVAMGGAF